MVQKGEEKNQDDQVMEHNVTESILKSQIKEFQFLESSVTEFTLLLHQLFFRLYLTHLADPVFLQYHHEYTQQ